MLGGKCRYCHKRISAFYLVVEILTAVLFIFVFLRVGPYIGSDPLRGTSIFALISALIVIFFADLKYHLIPDEATGLLMLFSLPVVIGSSNAINHVFGAVVAMLTILFLYILTKGRGMGFGDVKLALAMGFLLGLKGGLLALYIAFLTGGVAGLLLLIFGKNGLKSKIAFGPFLVLGTIIMLFWSEKIYAIFDKILGV